MNKLLLCGCATWLLTMGLAHAQSTDQPVAPKPQTPVTQAPSVPQAPPPVVWAPPVTADTTTHAAAAPAPKPADNKLTLDQPTVVNTAKLRAGDLTVSLYGIDGLDGDAVQGLQSFLNGQHVTCEPVGSDGFTCLLPDGSNVAQAALINGVARAKADAPQSYHDNEAKAQAARRGVWANLSLLPPATLNHPIVQDTATLVVDQTTYILDGLRGLGQPYAAQLQDYIVANGDRLICLAQARPDHVICTTNDATDIAKIALTNGAAVIEPVVSDSYRAQQADAMANRRGIWANAPPAEDVTLVAGDDGMDGITYINGDPMAWIDGQYVFLTYYDNGWGYYDGSHGWHIAPAVFAAHMGQFHPGGQGLGGHGGSGGSRNAGGGSSGHGSGGFAGGGHEAGRGSFGGHEAGRGSFGGHEAGREAGRGGAREAMAGHGMAGRGGEMNHMGGQMNRGGQMGHQGGGMTRSAMAGGRPNLGGGRSMGGGGMRGGGVQHASAPARGGSGGRHR
jgi:endonuclease YncB( thermonuclease family)